jgi:hypothetical protein
MRSPLASPVTLLRAEGVVVFVLAAAAYHAAAGAMPHALGWGWFALLFFLPDVAMLGYLRSPATGAQAYNLLHTEIAPALLLAWAALSGHAAATSVGLVWLAHIGFDRAFGYGLKSAEAFGHTHLGRIGRAT